MHWRAVASFLCTHSRDNASLNVSDATRSGVVASIFGILILYILAAPRVYQAMADDDLIFRRFAKRDPTYETPHGPILPQGAWGSRSR